MAVKFLTAAFVSSAAFLIVSPAYAAGGGGPAPTSNPSCSTKTTKNSCQALAYCYWSGSANKCKKRKNQSELSPSQKLYAEGRILAKTGHYEKAISILKTADQSDPHVLNYLGYSYRKSGDLTTAITYYKAALAIDPDFVLAREYLGEGYVKAGRLDLAKLELEEIGKRCGKGCKEYVELAAVIAGTDTATW
ncbi:MAG: tetratricopeptide repeat protein [Hyphomicrobiaceae bacterium]|nr:tetratricopeptide repeat protein [Hyphomicrobiaceae bacterium]